MSTNRDSSIQLEEMRQVPFFIRFFRLFENLSLLVVLLIVAFSTSLIEPRFLTVINLNNIVITTSIIAVAGFGMTFAIIMQGFDLSIGSTQALTACIAASLLVIVPMPVAILGALLVGLLIGIVNGVIIGKLNVPPFVATLGMRGIVRGMALIYTKGQSVMIIGHNEYALLNAGKVIGIPIPLIIALGAFVMSYVLLSHTPFGRHVCAVGGNKMAAISAGLKINVITIAVFGLVSLMAALSGVMLSSQLMIVDGTISAGLELKAIAISVLGGTKLSGGSGNLSGTLIAAFLLAVIDGALNILKISAFYQYLALGALLIFALVLDTLRRRLIARTLKEA